MSIRVDDQGITLRLFSTDSEARKINGAFSVIQYGAGWLVRDGKGHWIDADGPLPLTWKPAQGGFDGS